MPCIPCYGKYTFTTRDIDTCEVFACGHYAHQLQHIGHFQINNCCQEALKAVNFHELQMMLDIK